MALLLNDFYTINSFDTTDTNKVLATLTINPEHPIFEGHFPGQPVTPGVCMMQVIKELGEKWFDTSLQLKTAKNVKFMAVINPEKSKSIAVELVFEEENESFIIKSTTSFEDTVALKYSGVFQKI